jgi:hypothetical protein
VGRDEGREGRKGRKEGKERRKEKRRNKRKEGEKGPTWKMRTKFVLILPDGIHLQTALVKHLKARLPAQFHRNSNGGGVDLWTCQHF